MTIDLQAYLDRIGYTDAPRVDFATLRALHRAHCFAISYENFDVQLQRAMTTDPYAAFEKIVGRRRGGWCYEQNGVLGLVLETIGFNVKRLAADGSKPFSHLVLTVDLNGVTYVCDAGFSDGPSEPYPLQAGAFVQDGFEFRIETETGGRWRLHNHRYGLAPSFYASGPDEPAMQSTCQWLQSSPESPFVQHVIVCRRTASGYVTLVDRVLRWITPSGVTRRLIESADEYVATLKTQFDLYLPETEALWPTLCERHETYVKEAEARRALKERVS